MAFTFVNTIALFYGMSRFVGFRASYEDVFAQLRFGGWLSPLRLGVQNILGITIQKPGFIWRNKVTLSLPAHVDAGELPRRGIDEPKTWQLHTLPFNVVAPHTEHPLNGSDLIVGDSLYEASARRIASGE